jgi:pyruvate dehydrogenase E1 component alpha subunit
VTDLARSAGRKADSAPPAANWPRPEEPERFVASAEQYLAMYREMVLIRRFEERAGQLYGMGQIGGFCHLYIGQEAVVVGMQAELQKGDSIITGYRDHGHMLACGIPARAVMAELTGRAAGISGGKGGSMHMFSVEHGFYGGHGIVAAQVPLGTGLAFAHKYKGDGHIAVTYFGDGASNQGQVYESFNMAELWSLPVIFIIENNQYAMGTSVERTSNVTDLSKLGASFEMPAETVDGMRPDAVCEAIERAADRARRGDGPTLLDIKTYRYKGHSMSDPQKYRTKEEVAEYQEQDPIEHVLRVIRENGWMTEAEIEEVETDVKTLVDDSVKFAEESPLPTADELYKDVYTQEDYPYVND